MALRVRGEALDEITGAASAMRARMLPVKAPSRCDRHRRHGGAIIPGPYNISTLAAFIVAACGVPVAKHGNRAASSKSGAADVLSALGVTIGREPHTLERCLEQANLCFMFAQTHHASMRHVGPFRVELGTRTIFNLLGPLTNPAGVRRQLLGVFSDVWIEPLAKVLGQLGSQKVWVVHGSDGLDEITTTGETHVAAIPENGTFSRFTIHTGKRGHCAGRSARPEGRRSRAQCQGDARRARRGRNPPYRDIAVINAGASLVVAEKARDLKEGRRHGRRGDRFRGGQSHAPTSSSPFPEPDAMADILKKIEAYKREEIAIAKAMVFAGRNRALRRRGFHRRVVLPMRSNCISRRAARR